MSRSLRLRVYWARVAALGFLGASSVDTILEKHTGWDPLPESAHLGVDVLGLVCLLAMLALDRHRRVVSRAVELDRLELLQRRHSDLSARASFAARRRRVEAVLASVDEPQMVFQPIVDLATGRVLGHEALARFAAGPPDEWFAEAVLVGLGVELEVKAIRLAFEAFAAAPTTGGYLSVNCSPATLLTVDLTTLGGVDLHRVVVELTEHVPVAEYEALCATLTQLRGHGVRVAVDDAGAGYASLQHIVHLEPEIIKLDRIFTLQLNEPHAEQLIRSIVGFATAVSATVVAEGVETVEHLHVLRELGVSAGQGWLLGRPESLQLRNALTGGNRHPAWRRDAAGLVGRGV